MTSEWSYQDVPISKFNVVTEPNPLTGEIKQIATIAGKVTEEIWQTREDHIRNALIDLGWKPPEGEAVPSKLPRSIRKEFGPRIPDIHFTGIRIVDMNRNDLMVTIAFLVAQIKSVDKNKRVD